MSSTVAGFRSPMLHLTGCRKSSCMWPLIIRKLIKKYCFLSTMHALHNIWNIAVVVIQYHHYALQAVHGCTCWATKIGLHCIILLNTFHAGNTLVLECSCACSTDTILSCRSQYISACYIDTIRATAKPKDISAVYRRDHYGKWYFLSCHGHWIFLVYS